MKAAILALALVLATSLAHAGVTPEHPLDDAAKVVPDADEPALEAELKALRAAGVDLAVIVINTTGGTSIETYARDRAKAWATGTTPAAVFVLAIKDRKSRLEVSDPLRPKFPDARAQSILDNIKGYLRSGDYTGAIRAVITEVTAGAGGVAPDLESPHPQVQDPSDTATPPPTPAVTEPVEPTPAPEPSYHERSKPFDWTPILILIFGGGGLVFGAYLWAKSRVESRATMTANGVIAPDRSIFVETLWCICMIIGGILYIAAIIAMSSSNSRGSSWSSSSSSWGSSSSSSFGGGSSFSGGSSSSSSGGGWSGGGASSGW